MIGKAHQDDIMINKDIPEYGSFEDVSIEYMIWNKRNVIPYLNKYTLVLADRPSSFLKATSY